MYTYWYVVCPAPTYSWWILKTANKSWTTSFPALTLSKCNIATENRPPQNETSLPTTIFQRLCQTSGGTNNRLQTFTKYVCACDWLWSLSRKKTPVSSKTTSWSDPVTSIQYLTNYHAWNGPFSIAKRAQPPAIGRIIFNGLFWSTRVWSYKARSVESTWHWGINRATLGVSVSLSPVRGSRLNDGTYGLILMGCNYIYCHLPSPELTAKKLKINGWKMTFPFGWPNFRGELLVSGRVNYGIITALLPQSS